MNRLTDEQLKNLISQLNPEPSGRRVIEMAQELLTLRKENEMLKRVLELGDELAKHDCQCRYVESDPFEGFWFGGCPQCRAIDDYRKAREVGYESGGG